jgi:hypothetical protein
MDGSKRKKVIESSLEELRKKFNKGKPEEDL